MMPDLLEILTEPPGLGGDRDRRVGYAAALDLTNVALLVPGSDPAVNAVGTVNKVSFHPISIFSV